MKRTPIVDNSVQVVIASGPLTGSTVIVCDKPPDPAMTPLRSGSIAIRRRGGYTTHLGIGSGHSRAWYALASEYVEAVARYLRTERPDVYNSIEWWDS